jgi:hypothetical protein
MALEDVMLQLIGALNANTEAHGGKAAGKTVAAKPAGKPAETTSKITSEVVKAAVLGVRDTFGKPVALALIKKVAKAVEISAIKPSFYAAVLEACEEKMAEQGGEGDEATTEDDEL